VETNINCWSFLAQFLEWEMFQTKAVEQINTRCLRDYFSSKNHVSYKITWKNVIEADWPQLTILHGACALHAGKIRPQTHIQNLLLFHANNGYANASVCYVVRTLPVLFHFRSFTPKYMPMKSVRQPYSRVCTTDSVLSGHSVNPLRPKRIRVL
jgi:hypothetical protein